jgi:hypothetical protein
VRVRIRLAPSEPEIDGVRLDNLVPGMVREVSASVGSWLIAQGYAVPEMRAQRDRFSTSLNSPERATAADRRPMSRRRRGDR